MFGALAVFTYSNIALVAAGIIALFCVKKAAKLVFSLMSVFCVVLCYFAYTAQPQNFAGMQSIAMVALFAAGAAVVLRFILKKSFFLAKLLLCGSALASLWMLVG